MNSEPTTTSERDEQLRRLLVATATAEAGTAPKRSRTLISSIVAFAVAGAVTGGAISAAALSNNQSAPTTPTNISIEDMTRQIVHDDTQLFGTPFILRSTGVTDIDLGPAPAGATRIALAFHCLHAGTFEYTLDGEPIGSSRCSENDTQYTNGGRFLQPSESNDHTLRISAGPDDSFVIWASWATPAPKAPPSAAQQEALADGAVTEAEYRAGWDRYSECMSDAGYPLVAIDQTGPIIQASYPVEAATSGHEARCYVSEFEQLDSVWQLQARSVTD